jgi:dihydropteroate synthase
VKLTALAPRPGAVREALVARGVPAVRADATAAGLQPAAVVLDGVTDDARERVARAAVALGIACLSGTGWVLLTGDTARLAGLIRPDDAGLPADVRASIGAALRGVAERSLAWVTARGDVALDRPVVVGILNVTPDSFSDGGRHFTPGAALQHAEALLQAGAAALDVGAESTRPGRPDSVSLEEEWRRLAPVLPELARRFPATPVSVDTVKAETARRALEEGVWAINDVTSLRHDPAIADVCAARGAGLVLMHSRGTLPALATYDHASYGDVVREVSEELAVAARQAEDAGVARDGIVLDPGLGFAKRPEHNYLVLQRLDALAALGYPLMVGPSRKRFLGAVTGKDAGDRDVATAAACVAAYERGARLFRVHAVAETCEALAIAHAVESA